MAIYQPHAVLSDCQLSIGTCAFGDLFFEPFDQLMRLQLLASAMERGHEMGADIASVLHIAPRTNDGLMNLELSCKVAPGDSVGEVWSAVVQPDRFKAVATEDLIPLLVASGADPNWTDYIGKRYGAIGVTAAPATSIRDNRPS